MTIAFETPLDFTTTEGLRLMLVRLRYSGTGWSNDPDASDLMAYAMEKYGTLARKYGYEPVEAAIAAFEAMHTRAVRVADDPWAVVTRAVELTLIYDQRADGLLCSNHQARREVDIERHDAERFSDREAELINFHPAFAIPAPQDSIEFEELKPDLDVATEEDDPDSEDQDDGPEDQSTNAWLAVDDAVDVFVALRWPEDLARSAIDYICTKLLRCGNRHTAFEALRRDRDAQAILDVDQRAWLVFLRVILGNQHPDRRHTLAGRGMLLRLIIGDQAEDLLRDKALVAEIASVRQPARLRTVGGRHV
jgi:hypothetical protein